MGQNPPLGRETRKSLMIAPRNRKKGFDNINEANKIYMSIFLNNVGRSM